MANWRIFFTKLVYYGRMEVIMNKYVRANIIFNSIWTTIIVIWLCEREEHTSFIQDLLTAAIPVSIGAAATLFTLRNSQINKNTAVLKKLQDKWV